MDMKFSENLDKSGQEKIKRDIELIDSGEINKIYPVLKPSSWIGVKSGALYRAFFGTKDDSGVVIGFAYNATSNFVFINESEVIGSDQDELINKAYENLEEIKIDFEVVDVLDSKILTCSGYDFSSEKILSKNHMMKAHQLLGSDELLVSIPRRSCMMICSKNESDEVLKTFFELHQDVWEDDSFENALIADILVNVVNGEVVSAIVKEVL
jgi:hypothetical protein